MVEIVEISVKRPLPPSPLHTPPLANISNLNFYCFVLLVSVYSMSRFIKNKKIKKLIHQTRTQWPYTYLLPTFLNMQN